MSKAPFPRVQDTEKHLSQLPALHLLQKLGQPVGARPLGEQHRLQGRRIVRKRVMSRSRHDRTTAQPAPVEAPDLRR